LPRSRLGFFLDTIGEVLSAFLAASSWTSYLFALGASRRKRQGVVARFT